MVEGITDGYVNAQQAQMQQQASMMVLDSSLDTARAQGAQMTQMLESAGAASMNASDAQVQQGLAITDPAMGQQIDLTV